METYYNGNKSLLRKSHDLIQHTLERNIGNINYNQHINYAYDLSKTNIGDVYSNSRPIHNEPAFFNFLSAERQLFANYYLYALELNNSLGYNALYHTINGLHLDEDLLYLQNDYSNSTLDEYNPLTQESENYLSYRQTLIFNKETDDYVYGKTISGYDMPHQLTKGYNFYNLDNFYRKGISIDNNVHEDIARYAGNIGLVANMLKISFDSYLTNSSKDNLTHQSTLLNNDYIKASLYSIDNKYGSVINATVGVENISTEKGDVFARLSHLHDNFNRNLTSTQIYTYAEAQIKNIPIADNAQTQSPNIGVNNISFASFQSNKKIDDLMNFTNRNFRKGQYDTIVSRFGSYAEGTGDKDTVSQTEDGMTHSAVSRYGTSHGRNLLRKEGNRNVHYKGGEAYNDPYCRVWTNYHQYSRVLDLIRPFTETDSNGENATPISSDLLYSNYGFHEFRTKAREGSNGNFDNGQVRLGKLGVLNQSGFVNITPKLLADSEKAIKTKQCMFSIENLAWKGFTSELSEEQIGPLGGRIMWFPPYDIKFNESVSSSWNSTQFIGRGESIYTYTNTERNGSLSFKLIIDHPSLINFIKNSPSKDETDDKYEQNGTEYDLLRFFAGCGIPETSIISDETKKSEYNPPMPVLPTIDIAPSNEKIIFFVYYPNNYTGNYEKGVVDPIVYLLNGIGSQKRIIDDNVIDIPTDPNVLNYVDGEQLAYGYEVLNLEKHGITPYPLTNDTNKIIPCKTVKINDNLTLVPQKNTRPDSNKGIKYSPKYDWWYRVDERPSSKGKCVDCEILPKTIKVDGQNKTSVEDHKDLQSYGLNSAIGRQYIVNQGKTYYNISDEDTRHLYAFTEVYSAFNQHFNKANKLSIALGNDTKLCSSTRIEELLLKLKESNILKITTEGFASKHGYAKSNEVLMNDRGETVKKWVTKLFNNDKVEYQNIKVGVDKNELATAFENGGEKNASEILAKMGRCTKVTVYLSKEKTQQLKETVDTDGITQAKFDRNTLDLKNLLDVKSTNKMMYTLAREKTEYVHNQNQTNPADRYDNEYRFFQQVEITDSIFKHKIKEKIRYFDPAYHSISPEGFNARLTFLHQCTRQGPTIGNSNYSGNGTANNLAFGRQPVCVLRVGDFYNTKIIIENINIDYEPLVWDLNQEGVGVQPMIANIQLGFKFIGGSDLAGPIGRLQNAVSFNYYANTSVYDNRAEMIEYSDESHKPINYRPYDPNVNNIDL